MQKKQKNTIKALVMACSTGGGHISAAEAVCKAMAAQNIQATFLDPYTLSSSRLANAVGDAYIDLVQFKASLFGDVYKIGQFYDYLEHKYDLPDPVMDVQKHIAELLGEYLDAHPVDVIVCCHPYPAFMVSLLKLQGKELPASMMVATDYTCIPFENDSLCDWMVIGATQLIEEFVQAGVSRESIVATGIPVDPDFDLPLSKQDACKTLHLDSSFTYILLAGGSMGSNTIDIAIEDVRNWMRNKKNVRLLVVCGHNQKLKDRLDALHDPQVEAVGFTDHMRQYVAAADVYITKPGGLSITEAAAAGVPLILTDPIPGCETRNAPFFEHWGMADYATNPQQLHVHLDRFLADTERSKANAARMLLAQRSNLPHPSAKNLVDFCWEAMHLHKQSRKKSRSKTRP